MDPNPISGVLTDRHTGRRPGDHGGRGWNDASTGQGTPRIASNIRSQKQAKKDHPPELSDGGWSCAHLDLRPPACRTVRDSISVLSSQPGASLVAQWYRILLPMQETWV